jgi:thiamine-monophosphate kinase
MRDDTVGELKLIKHFRAHAPRHPWITVGPGQDCAVLNWPAKRELVFKIDQVVEGTHFTLSGPGAATPRQVGWKALAKACSDIAAAGCWPVAAMVAVNLRRGTDKRLALEVFEGLRACCERFRIGLAGGDVSVSKNGLSVAVSLIGEGPKRRAWTRRGARARLLRHEGRPGARAARARRARQCRSIRPRRGDAAGHRG